jgi:hypothetical protein
VAGRAVYFRGLFEAERNASGGRNGYRGDAGGERGYVHASAATVEWVIEHVTARYARRGADMLGVRHADGAERGVLQMRELRQYERLQLGW